MDHPALTTTYLTLLGWHYITNRHQNGIESNWLNEEEAQESFTPLQLDVLHALWEQYQGS